MSGCDGLPRSKSIYSTVTRYPRGEYARSIVAVSHRWDASDQLDPTSAQLREYLCTNSHIEAVFYDYYTVYSS